MTALRRLVRHYLLRRPYAPRHAKPQTASPRSDDLIPFADNRHHPYDSQNGTAA